MKQMEILRIVKQVDRLTDIGRFVKPEFSLFLISVWSLCLTV
jgi:hypothetical protein